MQHTDAMEQIQVSVAYRERIALPPGATLSLALEDTSRADAPAIVLACTTLTLAAVAPFHRFIFPGLLGGICADAERLHSFVDSHPDPRSTS
jgi:putative lipoprotein